MARHVSSCIGEPAPPPPELKLFPETFKKKNSEKYAARNLLGLKDLMGFTCLYRNKGQELMLVLGHYGSEKEAINAEKSFISRLRPPPGPAEDGMGFTYRSKYMGSGRLVRIGSFLGISRVDSKQKGKAEWQSGLVTEFFDRLTKQAMKEKTESALKSLLGGGSEEKLPVQNPKREKTLIAGSSSSAWP